METRVKTQKTEDNQDIRVMAAWRGEAEVEFDDEEVAAGKQAWRERGLPMKKLQPPKRGSLTQREGLQSTSWKAGVVCCSGWRMGSSV